ncbi:MAG: oligoendopeptidase F [Anaerolinea sp.]|nr:oligoendopeptidase F [Anaerolinea sp.]
MTEITSLPLRSEIPVEQTWDLASVYPTPADWDAACAELTAQLPALAAFRGRLAEGPATLLALLSPMQEAGVLLGKILIYASNGASVDTGDQTAAARAGQARTLMANFAAATAFFDPELMAVGLDQIDAWIAQTPELAFFSHYVDRLRLRQAHVRSGEVEEVLALTGDPFSGPFNVYGMLNNADMVFRPAVAADETELEVGQASIGALVTHPDRAVRRSAWESYADSYLAFRNTHAAAFTAGVKQNVFNARVRGYASSLHASLESNYIPVEVFHNLIAVFKKHLPTWHRYWRLRKRALGLDALGVYDIKAPLAGSKPVVPFEQAVEWIAEGMAPLGQAYVDVLRRGCLEERWVDRARNRGKREGAYSSGSHGTHPFILMSYQDDLFSLSTLAHELGHSLHSYHTRRTQPFIYGRYGLFLAEVASNFNQAMVRDYLFRTQTERAFQIGLIEEAMSNYHRYFFIMPTLAQFELEAHSRAERGAPLSADILTGITADLFAEGYGGEVDFDQPRIGITWAQFGHMYMNFYVYQYATGISAAHALAQPILAGDQAAAGRYLDFLKSGGSRYPLETLQQAGVDMTTPEPVEAAFGVLAGLVDRLETLLE